MAVRDWVALSKPVTVEISGSREIAATLRKLGLEAPKALAAGLYEEAEGTMTVAKTKTPVETGNLRASGHVATPVINGPLVEIELGFGGPAGSGNHGGQTNAEDVGYALYVHERVELHHPVGQAKFLEAAFQERQDKAPSRLAAHLRRSWDRIVDRGVA